MKLPFRTVSDLGSTKNFEALETTITTLLPGAGEIRMWALSTAPTGWAVCDGSVCPAGDLQTQLLADGSPYGTSGANPLLPDLRGRAPIGAGTGSGLTARTLGAAVGAETHLLSAAESGTNGSGATDTDGGSTTGTESNDHTHTPSNGGVFVVSGAGAPATITVGGASYVQAATTSGRSATHTHTVPNHSHSLAARAADNAHANMQPSRVLNFIIKT